MSQDREGRGEWAAEASPSRAVEGSPGARTLTQGIARSANAAATPTPTAVGEGSTAAQFAATAAPAEDPYGFHLLGGAGAGGHQQAEEVPHRGEMEQLFGQSFGGVRRAPATRASQQVASAGGLTASRSRSRTPRPRATTSPTS